MQRLATARKDFERHISRRSRLDWHDIETTIYNSATSSDACEQIRLVPAPHIRKGKRHTNAAVTSPARRRRIECNGRTCPSVNNHIQGTGEISNRKPADTSFNTLAADAFGRKRFTKTTTCDHTID
jgi:hypothetical protein